MAHSTYTPEIAERICMELAMGRSLRSICQDAGMPDKATVLRWVLVNDEFRDQYARAREMQAEGYLDDIIEIADDDSRDVIEVDTGEEGRTYTREQFTAPARDRLKIDARKWAMAKMAPKKYGDSKQIDVTSGGQRVTGIAIVDYADDSEA